MLNIFKVETTEYINDLNSGLLKYEQDPNNSENLDDIFRTAHSIKGAARMLGLTVIEEVSHELEDILGLVKNNNMTIISF